MLPRVAPTPRWGRLLFPALITLVVAYGALVRLDRLFRAYGPFDHPGWLVRVQQTVGALRDPLVPRGWTWKKVERPYVGGDPIGYLRFARGMRHFYQGHFREPVFLATTRMYLSATDDQDVAISLASLSFSVACVFATYLLGSTLGSRWAGLFAATAVAVEYEIVTWAPDGWRDEAFSTFVLLSAAAFLRLQRRWTWPSAVLVGVAGAAACLTRLSSLTFLVPAVLWLAWPRASVPWRTQIARLGLALGVMTVLVSPYLINCFRETGDPFIAVNQHTGFYQPSMGIAMGIAMDSHPNALVFTMAPFVRKPIATTDTALRGLFVTPFATKWRGFTDVLPLAGQVLPWLAAAGLVAWLTAPSGRLVLVDPHHVARALHVHLVAAWRGSSAIHDARVPLLPGCRVHLRCRALNRGASALVRDGARSTLARVPVRRTLVGCGLVVLTVGLARLEHYWVPHLVARESLKVGDSVSIGAGSNDRVFFKEGWSDRTGRQRHRAAGDRLAIDDPAAGVRTASLPVGDSHDPSVRGRADSACARVPRRARRRSVLARLESRTGRQLCRGDPRWVGLPGLDAARLDGRLSQAAR